MSRGRLAFWWLLVFPLALLALWGLFDDVVLFLKTLLNGLTLASLYFIVASGFTLVFLGPPLPPAFIISLILIRKINLSALKSE